MTPKIYGLAATLLLITSPLAFASLELVPMDTPGDGGPKAVTFSEPITGYTPDVEGKSLEDLLNGSPLHAPIDGLPDTLWKDKACSTCHQWSREDLCEQGKRYVSGALDLALTKPHPYGGGFKQSVNDWANQGCQ